MFHSLTPTVPVKEEEKVKERTRASISPENRNFRLIPPLVLPNISFPSPSTASQKYSTESTETSNHSDKPRSSKHTSSKHRSSRHRSGKRKSKSHIEHKIHIPRLSLFEQAPGSLSDRPVEKDLDTPTLTSTIPNSA